MTGEFVTFVILCFVIVHIVVHDVVLHVKFVFVVVEKVQLPLQVGNVGLQHGLGIGGGCGLLLQQLPLGIQHFILLLQKSHLWHTNQPQNQWGRNVYHRIC